MTTSPCAKHPAIEAGCTIKETHAFEMIATRRDAYVWKQTADALVDKGLVTTRPHILPGLPPVAITIYEVPPDILSQWQAWNDENEVEDTFE